MRCRFAAILSIFAILLSVGAGVAVSHVLANPQSQVVVYFPVIYNVAQGGTPDATPTATPYPYQQGPCGYVPEGFLEDQGNGAVGTIPPLGWGKFWVEADWPQVETVINTVEIPENDRAVIVSETFDVSFDVPVGSNGPNINGCTYNGTMDSSLLASLLGSNPTVWLCDISSNGAIVCTQPNATPTTTPMPTATGTSMPTGTPTHTITPMPTETLLPSPTSTPTFDPYRNCGPSEQGGILHDWYSAVVTAILPLGEAGFWATSDNALIQSLDLNGNVVDSFQVPQGERAITEGYWEKVRYNDVPMSNGHANIWGCSFIGTMPPDFIGSQITAPYWHVIVDEHGEITEVLVQ